MTRKTYQGVILAAGRGTRMAPFSDRYPKPILPICNKPVIQYQIELMKSLDILDIIILVGHRGFEISKVLGDGSQFGLSIRYAEQSEMLGIAHALGRLEPEIDKPFLTLLGDIFIVPGDLKQMFRLFEEQNGGAILATKEESDPDAIRRNFSLNLREDGTVSRVIEKPRYTSNPLKGVGLYLFDTAIFDAIRRTPRTAMRDEYELTDSIQVFIDDGHLVRPALSIIEDINLTTPQDILFCNLKQLKGNSLIGEGCSLHPGTTISNSIIGANVKVKYPIEIKNSVVFQDTCIDSVIAVENYVVTPDCMVDCKHGTQLGKV